MAIHLFKAFLSQCYRLSRWLHDTAANNNWTCGQGNLLRQVKCPCQIDDISFKQKKSQNSIRVPSVWKAQKPVTKGTACFNKKHRPYKHVFTKNLLISSREDWSKEGLVCSFHPPTFIPEHPKQHRIIWGWMKRHLVNMKLSDKECTNATDKKKATFNLRVRSGPGYNSWAMPIGDWWHLRFAPIWAWRSTTWPVVPVILRTRRVWPHRGVFVTAVPAPTNS